MVFYRRLFLLAVSALIASCAAGERWIKHYGYNPIRPASTLLEPGALLMHRHGNNTATRLLCSASDSLGPDFRPSLSQTVSGKFRNEKNRGWHLSADVLSQAKASANAQDVVRVDVRLENARIVHITDADIYRNVANRSFACQLAIEARRNAGWDISMVKSALMGDVTYEVQFSKDAHLDVSAKLAQVQQLSLALGGNISSVSETMSSATGLVWGIKEDRFLAEISISPDMAKRLHRNSRMLPSNLVVEDKCLLAPTTPDLVAPIGLELQEDEIAEQNPYRHTRGRPAVGGE